MNSHVHVPPNFSAFDTVHEAVSLAAAQHVSVLGVNNYYDFSIYGTFASLSWSKGVFPLFGLEVIALLEDLARSGVKVNDPGNPGKVYLCGKGITRFDPMTSSARPIMEAVRSNDSKRIAAAIERLGAVFAAVGLELGVTEEAIKAAVAERHGVALDTVYLQERHVARAFQEALFQSVPPQRRAGMLRSVLHAEIGRDVDAVSVQNALRSRLMKAGQPAYVKEEYVEFDQAYRLILELGGVPCYPILADGASPISQFEAPVDQLIQQLGERGVYCAELIPNRNDPGLLADYVYRLRSAGIALLAGTEHNTLDQLPMEPRCAGGVPIPEPVKEIFWEGACVVAAHQYLTVNGECGFVDRSGSLNPGFANREAAIGALAELGAMVIGDCLRSAVGRA